jgi:putative transposase
VLRHRFGWKRLWLAGGSAAHLVFQLRPGAYTDETLIEFVTDVRHLEQPQLLLIWGGLPSHRGRRMLELVASQHAWFRIEHLPGCAPELNPIEQVS